MLRILVLAVYGSVGGCRYNRPLCALQDVPGQTRSFVTHIQLGVREAAADPDSLLLFSGGKTRK